MIAELVRRHRWIGFVLPFLIYMLAGALEPTATKPGGTALGLAIPSSAYPLLYAIKIAVVIAAMILVSPGYHSLAQANGEVANSGTGQLPQRAHLFRMPGLSILVGVVGIVVWIGLCRLGLDRKLLEMAGLGKFLNLAERPAVNPFEILSSQPAIAWAFLTVRFVGLALVVPVIEEFFLRGFLMRVVMAQNWWEMPLGKVDKVAVAACLVYAGLSHPGELFAALAWFGMVTWLQVRTRSLWDCVLAHAVTNLLLGLYVVHYAAWALW